MLSNIKYNKQNLETLKISYKTNGVAAAVIKDYRREYSSCLHIFYNLFAEEYYKHLKKGLELPTLTTYTNKNSIVYKTILNPKIQNVDLVRKNSHLLLCCITDAYSMIMSEIELEETNEKRMSLLKEDIDNLIEKIKSTKKIKRRHRLRKKISKKQRQIENIKNLKIGGCAFGSKALFTKRAQNKISKEEFKDLRLSAVYSIGQVANFGNRLFRISDSGKKIIVQFTNKQSKETPIVLDLKLSNNYRKIMSELFLLQQQKKIKLTYKLDNEYVYISFDEAEVYSNKNHHKKIINRVCSIDQNPDYLGWVIADWHSDDSYTVIAKGVYSLKKFTDEYLEYNKLHLSNTDPKRKKLTNARHHEIFEIVKNLISKCVYYGVSIFSVEKLDLLARDNERGKNFNAKVNKLWNRKKMLENIFKRCSINNIHVVEIDPKYSSVYGNLMFRELDMPDMVLAAMEIGRRGYEYYNQYKSKTKEIKHNIIESKSKVFIDNAVTVLESCNVSTLKQSSLYKLYMLAKSHGVMVRVPIDDYSHQLVRFKSKKSLVEKIEISS